MNKLSRRALLKAAATLVASGVVGWKTESTELPGPDFSEIPGDDDGWIASESEQPLKPYIVERPCYPYCADQPFAPYFDGQQDIHPDDALGY